ncbi:putative Histidine kinase [Candidatus Terasakiella magnetica]|uniref:histidine kinase n=1 Tax=Candidatus Terasakiella magnetica TaxID=1867952 RepID=A0A1C3RHG7_9PROT|nr:ATP-binding protein [Candidatus Terasakiella magnetica]SCA56711.1 putative Histidine kinase [Candidatus Terasakiella magnetica]
MSIICIRKDFLAVFFLTVAIIAVSSVFAWTSYTETVDYKTERNRTILKSLFEERLRTLEKLTVDYSYWDDTIELALLNKDASWANNNIGNYILNAFGLANSYLIDHENVTVFSFGNRHESRLKKVQSSSKYHNALKETVRQLRTSPAASGFFHEIEDRIFLVAISALTYEERLGERTNNEKAVLVLLKEVTEKNLNDISNGFEISGLTYSDNSKKNAIGVHIVEGAQKPSIYFTQENSFWKNSAHVLIPLSLILLLLVFLARLALMRSNLSHHLNEELQSKNAELLQVNQNLENEIKEQIKEINQQKELAESANRKKSTFLSTVTHELKTPLNSIMGFSQMLHSNKQKNLNKTQLSWVEQILDSGSMLLLNINDLLEFSRIENADIKNTPETFLPREVFKECYDIINPLAKDKNIKISGVPETDRLLHVDRNKLKQILLNLIGNAVKYNERNGFVKFGCRGLGADKIELYIEDNGIGIPKEDLEHIFEPFYRVPNVASRIEGTGIGLSIVKNNIEIMNGEIRVASTEGEGTCFTVHLPAHNVDTQKEPHHFDI